MFRTAGQIASFSSTTASPYIVAKNEPNENLAFFANARLLPHTLISFFC